MTDHQINQILAALANIGATLTRIEERLPPPMNGPALRGDIGNPARCGYYGGQHVPGMVCPNLRGTISGASTG